MKSFERFVPEMFYQRNGAEVYPRVSWLLGFYIRNFIVLSGFRLVLFQYTVWITVLIEIWLK